MADHVLTENYQTLSRVCPCDPQKNPAISEFQDFILVHEFQLRNTKGHEPVGVLTWGEGLDARCSSGPLVGPPAAVSATCGPGVRHTRFTPCASEVTGLCLKTGWDQCCLHRNIDEKRD
jgi:hypothetical protein